MPSIRLRNRWLLSVGALALLVVVGAACSDDSAKKSSGGGAAAVFAQVPSPDKVAPAGSKVFVGHDKANDASVGLIVFSDSKVVAYACDGDKSWTWYQGTVSGSDVTLTSSTGAKLTAKINGDAVTGTASGSSDFTLATARDHAGLYRASFAKGTATETQGWVIENDGTVRGGVTTVVGTKTVTAGAIIAPTQLADVQALPEFPDLKALAPKFPVLPPDLTVFTRSGGLCTRILENLRDSVGTTATLPVTPATRVRMGLLGFLGCPGTLLVQF